MARRATINDVAKAASVGKVTVSYVLNGRAGEVGISAATAERVIETARKLDYRPNGVARMLARKRADAIAVVFQHAHFFSVSSAFLNDAMSGVCLECVEQELDVLLHTKPTDDPMAEANALSDGRVDGVLMLRDDNDPTLAALTHRGIPLVLFFSRSNDPRVSYVDSDNFMGGKIAGDHLVSLGHRLLGMVAGSSHSIDSADRHHGFRSAIEAAGLSLDPSRVARMESPQGDPAELVAMMSRPDRPTALFVWSDDVAFECMRAFRELGIRIPEDVSIVGFDSTLVCSRVDPPLTSVRQPIVEMARRATQMLAATIREGVSSPQQIVFPPHLDVRGSTSPPPFEGKSMKHMKKAFTLIELLVVIAIIAILAAILFPVFAQAKAAAKNTVSISNMKQVGLGMLMYSADYDDVRALRRYNPAGNQISWRLAIAPYIKSQDLYKDSVNPAAKFPDLESDPVARAFFGWPPLQATEKFPRGYAWANVFINGRFADSNQVSMTSFSDPAGMFNIVESKEAWEDMGPYLAWVENVDSSTSWIPGIVTGLRWNWGSDKWSNKAMVATYMDGHAKRIGFSAACGRSFMRMAPGSVDVDHWGLSAAEQAGFSWADTWCTTLPVAFR